MQPPYQLSLGSSIMISSSRGRRFWSIFGSHIVTRYLRLSRVCSSATCRHKQDIVVMALPFPSLLRKNRRWKKLFFHHIFARNGKLFTNLFNEHGYYYPHPSRSACYERLQAIGTPTGAQKLSPAYRLVCCFLLS